jgi:hypothetical protein
MVTFFLHYHQSKYKKRIGLKIQVDGSLSRAWVNRTQESDDRRAKSIAGSLTGEQIKTSSPSHASVLLYSAIGRQAPRIYIIVL